MQHNPLGEREREESIRMQMEMQKFILESMGCRPIQCEKRKVGVMKSFATQFPETKKKDELEKWGKEVQHFNTFYAISFADP